MRVQLVTFLCLATTLGCSTPANDNPVEVTPQEVDDAIAESCSTAEATRQTSDGDTEPSHRIVCEIELKYEPNFEDGWAYFVRWEAFDEEGEKLPVDAWKTSPRDPTGSGAKGELEVDTPLFTGYKFDVPLRASLLRWHIYWCEGDLFDPFQSRIAQCEDPAGEFYRDYPLTPDDGELDDYELVIPDE